VTGNPREYCVYERYTVVIGVLEVLGRTSQARSVNDARRKDATRNEDF